MVNAGGKPTNAPPEIEHIDQCIYNCIVELSGERNQNGTIPFSSIISWGQWFGLRKYEIDYFYDVIKLSENRVKEWQQNRST